MKKMLAILWVALIAGQVAAQGAKPAATPTKTKGWTADFAKAKAEAAALRQPILAFFTGSDWCGWCVKLKREVLDTPGFKRYAADQLVLFEADFPRQRAIPDAVKKQNSDLAAHYGVRGFPTVLLLDAEGKVLAKTGYKEGGEKAYIEHLAKLLEDAGVQAPNASVPKKPLTPFEKVRAIQKQAEERQAEALDAADAAMAEP